MSARRDARVLVGGRVKQVRMSARHDARVLGGGYVSRPG